MAVQTLPKAAVRRRNWSPIPEGKLARREAMWFWFFVAPWAFGYLAFTVGPLVASGYFSLTRYNISSPPVWIGLKNYADMFGDRIFWKSLQVTGYYTLLAVPLGIVGGLALAMLLNQKVPFMGGFRTIFYLPSLVGGVAVVLMFQFLLNSQFGVVNYFLRGIGIANPPRWFQDPNWVMPAIVLMGLWGLGSGMLIYLSALQSVPTQLYEAATIDGAGRTRQFFNITIPMISPVILFTFITGVIGAFQVFTQAYIISNGTGGPSYSTMFYNMLLYLNAFRRQRMGLASAQAWVLFLVVLLLTILFLWASRRFVYYETDEEGSL
ncbi:MAG: sugar ABC transporter permease [Chloroflexales bacterium]|nr:sugar ABC transporter permease [Chloroflexales bacterium]